MYIDKYEIVSWGRKWNKGKESKKAEIIKSCYNDDGGMVGKKFLQLLSDLDDAWHEHEGKDCVVHVSFEDPKERE